MRSAALLLGAAACFQAPLVPLDPPDAGADAGMSQPLAGKVLFLLEVGAGVEALQAAAAGAAGRFSSTSPTFGVIFYGSIASQRQPAFAPPAEFATKVMEPAPAIGTPVAPGQALKLAEQAIAADLASAGEEASRTSYRVVLLTRSGEGACLSGTPQHAQCNAWLQARPPDHAQCARCELSVAARSLRGQLELQQAGRIRVQPVWVHEADDEVQRYALEVLALEGGTELVEATPSGLQSTLDGLDWSPPR